MLQEAQIPRGSFYHYFDSKDGFVLETLALYHQQQLEFCQNLLKENATLEADPTKRLEMFFQEITQRMELVEFTQGCLMSNLSMEIADNKENFRNDLKQCWDELCKLIGNAIQDLDLQQLGFTHLDHHEAATYLMNAWSGALLRMKVEKSAAPLRLFMRAVFKH